jgi:plasmid stability protein
VASLNVRDLPNDVYDALKKAARADGRSLNGYVVALLKASTEERERRKLMREHRAEFRAFLMSLPKLGDSTALIREDRERGH